MFKSTLIFIVFLITISCSSTVREANKESSEIASDASMIENSANNIDRAMATGQRLKTRFESKK